MHLAPGKAIRPKTQGAQASAQRPFRRRRIATAASLAIALAALLAAAPTAQAAPDLLLRVPDEAGLPGSGAGQLASPRAVAADPAGGHIYITESSNERISEYTAWGLFVRAWGWGVADGAPELQVCGPPEPQAEPDPALCEAGSAGAGRGQLDRPNGIAVDPAGDVYVLDRANQRVQKFSPEGEFLLMFGGEVNKTALEESATRSGEEDVCPAPGHPADACQAGSGGPAPSHLAGTVGNYIAYSPAEEAILVGDQDRIEEFGLDGAYEGQIDFSGELAAFGGKAVSALAVDSAGEIYFSVAGLEDIYKLSPGGEALEPGKPGASQFGVESPVAVAVDGAGNVFAVNDPPGDRRPARRTRSPGARVRPRRRPAAPRRLRRSRKPPLPLPRPSTARRCRAWRPTPARAKKARATSTSRPSARARRATWTPTARRRSTAKTRRRAHRSSSASSRPRRGRTPRPCRRRSTRCFGATRPTRSNTAPGAARKGAARTGRRSRRRFSAIG